MRTAIKAQQILKALFRNATSAMFQNKKLKRNATYAIAEVAEVVLCASNCALPTSGSYVIAFFRQNDWTSKCHYKALDVTVNQRVIPPVGIFKDFDCKVTLL